MLRPSRAAPALEFYWTHAQTSFQLTIISSKTYISRMEPDKQLDLYSSLKEQTPLSEENTILTRFSLKLEGTDIDPTYHVRSHLPENII